MNPRQQFAATASALVREDPSVALVYAEISGQFLGEVERDHPDRVVNVGIREQLLVNVGAGMALAGLRPIVHTFSSFLVERAFEQVKLGFGHQGVGGVLVGVGGSFDVAAGGRTHQAPGDMALLDTLPGISLHAPSTSAEVDAALRAAIASDGLDYLRVVAQTNEVSYPHRPGRFHVVRRVPGAPVVLAVGPALDAVLAATADRPATVLYANTIRPFDPAGLRAVVDVPEVVLVEPWTAGTSAHAVAEALREVPHRLLALGVDRRHELRRYGRPEEHVAAHGLDAAGLRASIAGFLAAGSLRAIS
ncbi:transketolase family protein [Nocardioides donggukensis]|uniref:Transketolase n=1 Tax=Nocardioides donggukensis TaxID=2774019 RepID=A0A927Q142_9ACTN|nr:transketolase [Nocardioides donggukensis]MBD8868381.1 transketolase [Nocardioides donggukensis]